MCACLLPACSSSDDANPGDAFVGTWTTTTGVESVIDCQFSSKTENLAISYSITKGDGSDLKFTSNLAPECVLKANVVGTRATVLENQTCTRSSADNKFKDTYRYATTSVLDMPQAGTGTMKLEATFRRALADGTDTGFECGYTEESPVKKQ